VRRGESKDTWSLTVIGSQLLIMCNEAISPALNWHPSRVASCSLCFINVFTTSTGFPRFRPRRCQNGGHVCPGHTPSQSALPRWHPVCAGHSSCTPHGHTNENPSFHPLVSSFSRCFHSHICPGSSSPMIPRSQDSDPLDFPSSPTETWEEISTPPFLWLPVVPTESIRTSPSQISTLTHLTQTSLQMHRILPLSQTKSAQYGEQP